MGLRFFCGFTTLREGLFPARNPSYVLPRIVNKKPSIHIIHIGPGVCLVSLCVEVVKLEQSWLLAPSPDMNIC